MLIQKMFLQHCRNFPFITCSEFEIIKKESLGLITKITKIESIPEKYKSKEEKTLITIKPFLTDLTQYKVDAAKFSILDILNQDEAIQSKGSLESYTQMWQFVIQNYLFLEDPEANIFYIYNCLSQFLTPAAFSGLILAFIAQNDDASFLFKTGILQHFFAYHIYDVSVIANTYQILQNIAPTEIKLTVFLTQCKNIHCGLDIFPQMNILGAHEEEPLKTTPLMVLSPPQSLNESNEKIMRLLSLLKIDFLKIYYLNFLSQQQIIQQWFTSLQTHEICALFFKIKENLSEETQVRFVQNLGDSVSTKTSYTLLMKNPKLFWMTLTACPQVYSNIGKKKLHQLCLAHPLESQDIIFAFHLADKTNYFFNIKSHLYQKIYDLYLEQDELAFELKMIKALKHFLKQTPWLKTSFKLLQFNLRESIKANAHQFNREQFQNIRDIYHQQLKKIEKLKILGLKTEDYPKDFYELSSIVLTKLHAEHTHPKIGDWIGDMIPQKHLEQPLGEEYFNHHQRLIHEWLNFISDSETIFVICKDILRQQVCDTSLLTKSLTHKMVKLEKFALDHPKYFSIYLNLFNAEHHIKLITAAKTPLIDQILKQKHLLKGLLKTLTTSNKLILLSMHDKTNEPYLFKMINDVELLPFIFKNCSDVERFTLFKLTNQNHDSILFIGLKNFIFLQQLLEYFPASELIQAFSFKNHTQETFFQKILNQMPVYQFFISKLEQNMLLPLLLETTVKSIRYIQVIANNEQLLNLSFLNLNEEAAYQVIQQHQLIFALAAQKNPEILSSILKKLSTRDFLKFLNDNPELIEKLLLEKRIPQHMSCISEGHQNYFSEIDHSEKSDAFKSPTAYFSLFALQRHKQTIAQQTCDLKSP